MKYGDITIFKMAVVRHFEYLKFEICCIRWDYCRRCEKNFAKIWQWPKL